MVAGSEEKLAELRAVLGTAAPVVAGWMAVHESNMDETRGSRAWNRFKLKEPGSHECPIHSYQLRAS